MRAGSMLTVEDQDRLRKLANYIAVGIPDGQAGAAVGFSPGRVSQLRDEDNEEPSAQFFRAELERASSQNVQGEFDEHTLKQRIVRRSLENLDNILNWNADPDLSLKALSVVSKLPKAGTMSHNGSNRPLNADNGRRALVQFNQFFVERANNGQIMSRTLEGAVLNKEVDFLNPVAMQALMESKAPIKDTLAEVKRMFDDNALIPGPFGFGPGEG